MWSHTPRKIYDVELISPVKELDSSKVSLNLIFRKTEEEKHRPKHEDIYSESDSR